MANFIKNTAEGVRKNPKLLLLPVIALIAWPIIRALMATVKAIGEVISLPAQAWEFLKNDVTGVTGVAAIIAHKQAVKRLQGIVSTYTYSPKNPDHVKYAEQINALTWLSATEKNDLITEFKKKKTVSSWINAVWSGVTLGNAAGSLATKKKGQVFILIGCVAATILCVKKFR